MNKFVGNIEEATLENDNFRKVLFTSSHSQLVVMALKSGEDIGMEIHPEHDQFIRLEQGSGKAILDGEEYDIKDQFAVVIPAGVEHNIVNTGEGTMKLYTIYSPQEHKDGTVHVTKADALENEEHFDGTTSL